MQHSEGAAGALGELREARAEPGARCARVRKIHAKPLDDARRARAAHQHLVGEVDRLRDRVGDEHHGGLRVRADLEEQVVHLHAGELVERAERFVHQKQGRLVHQRPAKGNALLHAAGKLVRACAVEAFEPNHAQQLERACARAGIAAAEDFHREKHVVQDVAPRHQVRRLEHEAEVGMRSVDLLAADAHRSAALGNQPRNDAKERGLAAPARTEQRDQLALLEFQRRVVDGHDRLAAAAEAAALEDPANVAKLAEAHCVDLAEEYQDAAIRPEKLPIAVVGAGPVGLTSALGLMHYGLACVVFEDEAQLSTETKAGTTLSRSLEIWRRFGAHRAVLERSMRVDEIGDIERATNRSRHPVRMSVLARETRFPYVINLPQQHMEPALAGPLGDRVRFGHRLVDFVQHEDRVTLQFENGERFEASYLLACDGGRSTVRERLGIEVEGESLPVRYALIDLDVDLDVANPRDLPYLAYYADALEWMILVRHPHCWRFLFPLADGAGEPDAQTLPGKAPSFLGGARGGENLRQSGYPPR